MRIIAVFLLSRTAALLAPRQNGNCVLGRPTLRLSRAANPARRRASASRVAPSASALTVGADAYTALLEHYPLATKVCTNAAVALAGDYVSQCRDETLDAYSPLRGARYAAKGVVGGFLWVHYFDAVDAWTAGVSGFPRVLDQMFVEQFLWCPIYFAFYDLPTASLFNGVAPENIPGIVRAKLLGMLASNAKLWTPANFIVYSVPLEYRLAASNVFDLAWNTISSEIAASCEDEEACDVVDAPAVARSR